LRVVREVAGAALAASASAARVFCSTSTMVTPPLRISPRLANTASTAFGARPAEGSSSISATGSTTSARAMASICLWPPESRPASSVLCRARSGNASYAALMRGPRRGVGIRPTASLRLSSTLIAAKTFSVCGVKASPSRMRRCAGMRVMSRPSKRTAPSTIVVKPAIALMSVDLPAPLGPSTATISPFATVIEAPLTIGRPGS